MEFALTVFVVFCWFALATIAWSVATYLFYIALNKLAKYYKYKKQKEYPIWLKILAGVFILFFDIPLNLIFVTAWFREIPRQWLVTTRMDHWRAKYENRPFYELSQRQQNKLIFAVWLCDEKLDYYDVTGDHC